LASLGAVPRDHGHRKVPDIQAAYKKLLARGLPAEDRFKPRVGRNQRWLLNLFDPDGSRTELMEPGLAK
jgi:hypothetical protein